MRTKKNWSYACVASANWLALISCSIEELVGLERGVCYTSTLRRWIIAAEETDEQLTQTRLRAKVLRVRILPGRTQATRYVPVKRRLRRQIAAGICNPVQESTWHPPVCLPSGQTEFDNFDRIQSGGDMVAFIGLHLGGPIALIDPVSANRIDSKPSTI